MQPLREPLFHFAVAGAILFGGYSWLNNPRADTAAVEPVRIGEGDVRWLKQTWSSQWLREPSAEELKGLVDAKYFGIKLSPEVPMELQERAYTSPIWYTPAS
jgi:hypothetical protein